MSWLDDRLRCLDTETTSADPLTARLVTVAIVDIEPGRRPYEVQWVLDPQVEVPAEAAAIHGWSRDRVLDAVGGEGRALRIAGDGKRLHMDVDGALGEIAGLVAQPMGLGTPVVAANAAYDLSLLEAELTRYGIDTLASRPSGVTGVVDPMVMERQFDPYRTVCTRKAEKVACRPKDDYHECNGCRGSRKHQCGGCGAQNKKLMSLCLHYGVPLTDAHAAAADARAAGRLSKRLAELWPQVSRWKLPTLHGHLQTWSRDQADSLREFWRKEGDERWREVSGDWPVLPAAYDVERLAVAS